MVASGLARKEAGVRGIDLSTLSGIGQEDWGVARGVEAAPKAAGGSVSTARPAWIPGPRVVAATPS